MDNRYDLPVRMRRLRYSSALRDMVAQASISADDLIMPVFICPGSKQRVPVSSMPGICQMSVDIAAEYCKELQQLGLRAALLFGIPEQKDQTGEIACAHNGIVQQAIKAIAQAAPGLLLVADLCNCEYTVHGHCGTIINGDVDNDATVATLARQAVSLAEAGANIIAPSDMMDGRVKAIRKALDSNGFEKIPIMSYSAKYASAFYGPFREAAQSAPQFGDRRTYQMDCRNQREALREMELDIAEGADMLMVKPALSYLDIIAQARQNFSLPIVAYNVSGEYSMVKAAGACGWIDEARMRDEILLSIKRAGADIIITYFTEELLRQGKLK
jgi:porphobilinogen synthase